MQDIVIKEVVTKEDKRRFINLPALIHRNDNNWLLPIYRDER